MSRKADLGALRAWYALGCELQRRMPRVFKALLLLARTSLGDKARVPVQKKAARPYLAARTRAEFFAAALVVHGSYRAAADAIGVARSTLQDHLHEASEDLEGATKVPLVGLGVRIPEANDADKRDAERGET